MKTERLDIGGTLALEAVTYEIVPGYKTPPPIASFEFVEHSPAHGYSDSETSITVDAAMARKIIDALNKHFEFNAAAVPLQIGHDQPDLHHI
ncbi:hypothetical protein [Rhodoferax sp.]|uniref:hypothetical protein n=1 Tax=Rhodoferax sp. TaxID=50421 RepID=UPI002754E5DC|nr:hypothetical protein [Rhodoferax sp.]